MQSASARCNCAYALIQGQLEIKHVKLALCLSSVSLFHISSIDQSVPLSWASCNLPVNACRRDQGAGGWQWGRWQNLHDQTVLQKPVHRRVQEDHRGGLLGENSVSNLPFFFLLPQTTLQST